LILVHLLLALLGSITMMILVVAMLTSYIATTGRADIDLNYDPFATDDKEDTRDSSTILEDVSDKYWKWKLDEFPRFARDKSDDEEDYLEEFTSEAFKRRKDKCQSFLDELHGVDATELTITERQNLAVLKADLGYFVDGYKWRKYGHLNPLNFLEGWRPPQWLGWQFHKEKDYRVLLKRMEAFIEQQKDIVVMMREAIRLKRTNHNVTMGGVVEELDDFLGKRINESTFYAPFLEADIEEKEIDTTIMDELKEKGLRMIEDRIYPAVQELKRFLVREYMPATRPHIGVGSFDNGQNYYQACLKFHLSSNLTAQEVRDIGLKEVKRIKGLMEDIMRREGFDGKLTDFFHYLREHRAKDFYGLTENEILEGYKNIVYNIIDPKLKLVFRNIPNSTLSVQEMGKDGPSGSYSYGHFWVNVKRSTDRPSFTMMALALHETNPGHHLQTIMAKTQPLPDFRLHGAWSTKYYAVPFNFPWYTAYTEGWSLYAEFLGEEMGCYNKTSLELFGRYSSEIFRACRLVVDTGIHAFNMTYQDAVDYLGNHTAIPTEQIHKEIKRYIIWPGQACAYKIGEIAILNMRKKAEQKLGDHFDVAEFHEMVLKTSRVPIDVLEIEIDEWIRWKSMGGSAVMLSTSNQQYCITLTICLLTTLFYVRKGVH